MWRVKLLLFFAMACYFIGECQGASTLGSSNQRFQGSMNRYYVMTWGQIINNEDFQEIKNTEYEISELHLLDGTADIAIVIHGRQGSAYSEFGYTIRNSFINKDRSMAVILLDWSTVSHLSYQLASASVSSVAADLSKFIVNMENQGKLDRSRLHLVGFDLGAHIAGIASRLPTSRATKVTALSPAGEGWGALSQRLRATDAQTVEVIHTDGVGSGAYGITEPIGTLDFFPNGGTGQPGCSDRHQRHLCFHNRAWRLFAASLDLNGHLIGRRCETMAQVESDQCEGACAILGTTELIKLQTGIYRLTTGRVWPYSV